MPNAWHVEPPVRTVMRRLVKVLSEKHGIPRARTRVVTRTGPSNGCYGYVRVFRGSGTKAERALFKLVYRNAVKLNPSSVTVLAPGEPEFEFEPEENR
jgi:hypothetical protein